MVAWPLAAVQPRVAHHVRSSLSYGRKTGAPSPRAQDRPPRRHYRRRRGARFVKFAGTCRHVVPGRDRNLVTVLDRVRAVPGLSAGDKKLRPDPKVR